jgi:dihydrofolate reductase
MGRKTYESLGKPLPGRPNIVISAGLARLPEPTQGGSVYLVRSVEEALARGRELAREIQGSELFVIGGEAIYRSFLPIADRLYLTEITGDWEGDAFFPQYDPSEFRELDRTERNEPFRHAYVTLERLTRS